MGKKSELLDLQEYRVSVENMGEGLIVLNKKMVPIFVNRKVCEITSYRKDEILGKSCNRFLTSKGKNKIKAELKKRLKGYPSRYTIKVRTKRGKEVFLSVSAAPRFDRKGKFNGTIAIISDFTEREELEDKLRERTLELEKEINKRTKLLVDLYRGVGVTEERNRLAREIHDFCSQDLATALLKIEICEKVLDKDPEKVRAELRELRKMLRKSIKLNRDIVFGLQLPNFHRTGFATVLRQYFKEFCKKTGIICNLNIKLERSLPTNIQVGTYRIIREAMNNVRKHAMARNVDARLITDKRENLHVTIKDDGKGFELKKALTKKKHARHFGLKGMEGQAELFGGTFAVKTAKGKGTEIEVKIPLKEQNE
ncbi:MAG: PAS domain-containing sensor histidine kinase [Elusimicrobiota bacterium]|nr:PAS domain-containing sensor histidine kinase [Elusimicrobiota bacterium]MDH5661713.1 PAS domain-containing sensor histidine kinase [Elusimicrobiota bacterium]